LLRHAGWQVNDKRVERIWRRAGLKVPKKQPKRGRQWLADGAFVCLGAMEEVSRAQLLDEFHAREPDDPRLRPLVFATDASFGPVRAIAVVRELAHPMGIPSGSSLPMPDGDA